MDIDEAYKDVNDYRSLVFGLITHVWVKECKRGVKKKKQKEKQ